MSVVLKRADSGTKVFNSDDSSPDFYYGILASYSVPWLLHQ